MKLGFKGGEDRVQVRSKVGVKESLVVFSFFLFLFIAFGRWKTLSKFKCWWEPCSGGGMSDQGESGDTWRAKPPGAVVPTLSAP